MSGLVQIATFQNKVEADLALLLLENAGIDVELFDVGMNHMGLGSIMPIRLMVMQSQAEEALLLLAEEDLG